MIKILGEESNENGSSGHLSLMPGEKAKWKHHGGSWIKEPRAQKRDLGGIIFQFNEMHEVLWEKLWILKTRKLRPCPAFRQH